ncbi:MAG TPA: hypothetical protein VGV86_05685, partial [Acidimicrobiales bacterium]|nr:hypothetical protein [Acidimicrobiales bacterium]
GDAAVTAEADGGLMIDTTTATHTAEPTAVLEIPRYRSPRRRRGLGALAAATVAMVGVGVLAFSGTGDDPRAVRSEDLGAATTVTAPAATTAPAARGGESPPTTPVTPTTRLTATTVPPPATTLPERLSADSRLRLDGVGPVRVGMTLKEASAAAGVPIRLLETPSDPGCRYAAPDRASGTGDELGFMVVDGKIVRIDVGIMGPDRIRTVSGVGKGSTEAEVLATYPGRIRVQPHPYTPNGRYLVYVPSDAGLRHLSMIFETVDGEVRSFRSGFAEQVSWKEGCS